jgi:predicted metal-dependent enzyme (double-stranded beta helix superfamily)
MNTLDEFIAASVAAAKGASPVDELEDLLKRVVGRPDWLSETMPEDENDETLLHVCDDLTIYHIKLSPGILYPPHSHGMSVVMGFYEGCETSLIFEEQNDGILRQTKRLDLEAPDVGRLKPDAIHAITNFGETTSRAVHYYLGDLLVQPRNLWNPKSHDVMPFNEAKYFEFAASNQA